MAGINRSQQLKTWYTSRLLRRWPETPHPPPAGCWKFDVEVLSFFKLSERERERETPDTGSPVVAINWIATVPAVVIAREPVLQSVQQPHNLGYVLSNTPSERRPADSGFWYLPYSAKP